MIKRPSGAVRVGPDATPSNPFLRDLGLAATALFAWLVSGCLDIRFAFARDHLEVAVASMAWRPQWQLGPWLLAVLGLAGAAVRHGYAMADQAVLGQRLRRSGLLVLALLGGRLAACWSPVLVLFPYLGILWSPHASWALAVVYLSLPLAPFGSPDAETRRLPLGNGSVAGLLFAVAFCAYGTYALYFCQVAMLHGDEGHYLLVTHSLLHDGDIDLTNDADASNVREFHHVAIEPHKAPASPAGKVHSVHPVGLSALLVPAYWAGFELWSNPRLGSALFMVVLASGCLPLAFMWLERLGCGRAISLAIVSAAGASPPLFLFSNQLYPEVPALFISLTVLVTMAHWQVRGGRYRDLGGRAEPLWLGLLGMLVGCLPFLHPRYAPLAAACAGLLLVQAWHSPSQRRCLVALGVVGVAAASTQIAFNHAFSGDWMGPYRPGNAWGEDVLKASTVLISLPGQWLHLNKGLLNSAPIYFLSAVGLLLGLARRDRRALVAAVLYALTAGANGLTPYWTFGYGFPARFMVTAIPALLVGFALAVPLVIHRRALMFLAALALAVSLETTGASIALPENAYEGENLRARGFTSFYPFGAHLIPPTETGMALGTVLFWALLLAGCYLAGDRWVGQRSTRRGLVVLVLAFLPAAYSRVGTPTADLRRAIPPGVPYVTSGVTEREPRTEIADLLPVVVGDAVDQTDGVLQASAPTKGAGGIARHAIPMADPGTILTVSVPVAAEGPGEEVSGHLVLQRRYTIPAVGQWEERFSIPLAAEHGQVQFTLPSENRRICYLFSEFSGSGSVSLGVPQVAFTPADHPSVKVDEAARVEFDDGAVLDGGGILGAFQLSLPAGVFRASFAVEGSAASTLFARASPPIAMAVYHAPIDSIEARSRLRPLAQLWATLDRGASLTISSPLFRRPPSESIQPAWWLSVPWVGKRAFTLDFALSEASEALVLLRYTGPLQLRLREIVVERLVGSPLAVGFKPGP